MIDEQLGRTAGAWLRDTDEPAFDPQGIVTGAMAQLPRVPQAKVAGLRARIEREVVPVPGTTRLVPDQQIRKGGPSMYPAFRFAMAAIALLATGGLLFTVMRPSTDDAVAPVPATSSASPAPTASAVPSESPGLSRSTDDGVFELTVTTPQSTWVADEPIEVGATFTYVGDEETAPYGGDTVLFEVEQLDGPVDSGYSRDLACPGDSYSRGQARTFSLAKSGHFDPRADDAAFWRAWFEDPDLRLPAGTYRIIAHGQYARPDCTDGTGIEAAVEIEVVEAPPSATPEASDVADASSQWGPLAVFTDPTNGPGGDVGLGPGVISIGERCVTFKADRAELPVALIWADDTVVWRPNNRRIVFTDRQGDVDRVNDGDRLMLGGVTMWPPRSDSGATTPEPGQRWSDWLDERWLAPPDASCPEDLWYVGEIDVRKRAEASTAPSIAPAESVSVPSMATLWTPVLAQRIPVSYSCGSGTLPFTTTDLHKAVGPGDVSPPIDIDALVSVERPPDGGRWRVAAQDRDQALLVRPIDPATHDGSSLIYVEADRADDGWEWAGMGDCEPTAWFANRDALGGYWRLDRAPIRSDTHVADAQPQGLELARLHGQRRAPR